ncbi:hypothetical protein ABZ547_08365 [Streptomyces sparsogenes]|uniref:hypothetical protein n=1 Tax=Streptomyces sparsogenes TaxID=67365 RepID=UPI0033FD83CD
MEMSPERRAKWISNLAEGARQEVSSAIGLLQGADDPGVQEAFRPLVQQLEEVHRALQDLT